MPSHLGTGLSSEAWYTSLFRKGVMTNPDAKFLLRIRFSDVQRTLTPLGQQMVRPNGYDNIQLPVLSLLISIPPRRVSRISYIRRILCS
jgi:hypothetical protein